MRPDRDQQPTTSLIGCVWFWIWALNGVVWSLSVEFGPLAAEPALLLSALLISRRAARRSAAGLLTGAGLPLLLIAYLQRQGPGATCYHTATRAGCDQHLNPIPWLLIGTVLVLTGLFTQAWRGDRHRRPVRQLPA